MGALSLAFTAPAFAADAPPKEVVYFDHAKVDAGFAKGAPLLMTTGYKIMTGRRVKPGQVEIHTSDTDVFYIAEGSATFVTGGTAPNAKETEPGEWRAEKIIGGTPHHLSKGDVIVIPAGIPHQYTEVNETFLYFVVKVPGTAAK